MKAQAELLTVPFLADSCYKRHCNLYLTDNCYVACTGTNSDWVVYLCCRPETDILPKPD